MWTVLNTFLTIAKTIKFTQFLDLPLQICREFYPLFYLKQTTHCFSNAKLSTTHTFNYIKHVYISQQLFACFYIAYIWLSFFTNIVFFSNFSLCSKTLCLYLNNKVLILLQTTT